MAVQVKVHREISDFQPKVIASLTVRQLKAVALFVVPMAALFVAAWLLLGMSPGGPIQWLAVAGIVPAVMYGWFRPKGLDFEVFARYVRAHWFGVRRFVWAPLCAACVAGEPHEPATCSAKVSRRWASAMDLKSKKVRRDVAVFEQTH